MILIQGIIKPKNGMCIATFQALLTMFSIKFRNNFYWFLLTAQNKEKILTNTMGAEFPDTIQLLSQPRTKASITYQPASSQVNKKFSSAVTDINPQFQRVAE